MPPEISLKSEKVKGDRHDVSTQAYYYAFKLLNSQLCLIYGLLPQL